MITDLRAKQKFNKNEVCERCCRPKENCLCGKVQELDNKIRVVILQHPQERFKTLNSARLAHLLLKNSRIVTGLSWPNFKKVAGTDELPSAWGVLFLKPDRHADRRPVTMKNRTNQPVENTQFLRGIIVLDGTWKQAKTLWWRNPWLLKLNRIGLNPDHPSARPQVKAYSLSTIESIALALEHLGDNPEIPSSLRAKYQELIIKAPQQDPLPDLPLD